MSKRGDSRSGSRIIAKYPSPIQARLGGARVPAAGTRGAVSSAGVHTAGLPAALLPVPGLLHGAALLQPQVPSARSAGTARAGTEELPVEATRSSSASSRDSRVPAETKKAPWTGEILAEQTGEQVVC
jgi:hypothetical protein